MMLCGNRTIRSMSDSIPSLSKNPSETPSHQLSRAQRQAAARAAAAKSKSKLWGPSHSFDSDDDSSSGKLGAAPRQAPTGTWWETMNKAWAEIGTDVVSTAATAPVKRARTRSQLGIVKPMEVVPEETIEEAGEESTDPSTQDDSNEHQHHHQSDQQQQIHLNQS